AISAASFGCALPVKTFKSPKPLGLMVKLVGAEGFEPSNTGSKDPRLTAWPRPNAPGQIVIVYGFPRLRQPASAALRHDIARVVDTRRDSASWSPAPSNPGGPGPPRARRRPRGARKDR